MEGVLPSGVGLPVAEQAPDVGLVLGEEEPRRPLDVEAKVRRELRVLHPHDRGLGRGRVPNQARLPRGALPGPRVPEPERRQHVKRRRLRPPVVDGHAHQDVVRARLRVLHHHVEVAVVVEDAGVEELELGLLAPAPRVLLDEARVRVLVLRVLVERAHVGVGGRGVEVEVVLLDVLAVVALGPGEAEEPLLQDGVAPVPEREGEAEALVIVGDAEQAVLAPPVGARARMVVREVAPRRPVRRVVLAHGAPLALGQIRPPPLPVRRPRLRLGEAEGLGPRRRPASRHGRTPGRGSSLRR